MADIPDEALPSDPARPSRIVHAVPGISHPTAPTTAAPTGIAPPQRPLPATTTADGGPTSEPATAAAANAPPPPVSKVIRSFDDRRRHEDSWARTPNTTGTGAIHVKTFHCKLTDEALVFIDQMINEWLDAHPQYEVKFVSSSIGEFTSKLREPHLIVQVWV